LAKSQRLIDSTALFVAQNEGYRIWVVFFFLPQKMSNLPPSLDFYSLCEIASFLTLDDFKNFVSVCRAWSACQHDLQTVTHVLRKGVADLKYIRETMSRKIYGRCLEMSLYSQEILRTELVAVIKRFDQHRLCFLTPHIEPQTWELILVNYGVRKLKAVMSALRQANMDNQPAIRQMLERVVLSRRPPERDSVAYYLLGRIPNNLEGMDDVLKYIDPNHASDQFDIDSFSATQCDLVYKCLANRAGGKFFVNVLRKLSQRRLPSETIRKRLLSKWPLKDSVSRIFNSDQCLHVAIRDARIGQAPISSHWALRILNSDIGMDADLLFALLLKCRDSVPVVDAIGTKRIPLDQQQVDTIYDCRIKHASKQNLLTALEALNRFWKPSHVVQYRLLSLGMNDPTLIEFIDVFNYGSASDLEVLYAVILDALKSKRFAVRGLNVAWTHKQLCAFCTIPTTVTIWILFDKKWAQQSTRVA
jgi:hypothetical protein